MFDVVYENEDEEYSNFNISDFGIFPIKYILLPILKRTGKDDLSVYYDVDAYIVTKAFITEKTEKINAHDGTHEISYKAILPFYVDHTSYNCIIFYKPGQEIQIDDVFDNYNDAKEYANEVNEQIFIRSICYEPFNYLQKHQDSLQKARQETYEEYDKIEKRLAKLTSKMEITNINWGTNIEQKTLLKRRSRF